MPNKSLQDLIKRVPGDYVIELGAYPSYDAFERDMRYARALCLEFDDFCSTVEDPRTRRLEAVFVHVSTLPAAMRKKAS